jgi:Tfp pilus assembly protein PilF
MSNGAGLEKLKRGVLLRAQGRLEDAEVFLKEAVAADPEDSHAFFELAVCQINMEGRRKEALYSINQAISLDPDISEFHSVKSIALAFLDRGKDALEAADDAIRLSPESSLAYQARARGYMAQQNWADAEKEARKALSLDPNDGETGNILASVLRLQGKTSENSDAVDKLLRDNPEDPYAHFNAGWSALQRSDYRKAEEHFREALRIDSEFDQARTGLIESFKARSPLFRQYLKYCFFMQRFQRGAQWAIIIGFYLAYRFGRAMLAAVHPVAATVLMIVYLAFVFWVWVAGGLGHFLILTDRSARIALKRSEALEGIVVGGGLIVGIGLAVAGSLAGAGYRMLAGGGIAAASIPAALTFTNESRAGRYVFGGILAYVYTSTLYCAIVWCLMPESELHESTFALAMLGLLLCAICTWIGNIPALRTARAR